MSTDIIVITGAESSGKTTLANQLADYWQAPLAPEMAREYLNARATYHQHDLLDIAKLQYQKEQLLLSNSPRKLVCDTDLLVIMIWSEVKYGQCDPWIYSAFEDCIKQKSYSRRYFLCDYNIPWQADPLRENPHNRHELFDLYLKKLKAYGLNFNLVRGNPQQRLQHVLNDFNS